MLKYVLDDKSGMLVEKSHEDETKGDVWDKSERQDKNEQTFLNQSFFYSLTSMQIRCLQFTF